MRQPGTDLPDSLSALYVHRPAGSTPALAGRLRS